MTDAAKIARGLTKAQARNLLALGRGWQTVSEMRHKGATGSGLDILYVKHRANGHPLCERQWVRWTGGMGYEYRITGDGLCVRAELERIADE